MTDLAKALAEVKSGIAYDDTLEIIINAVMSGELIPLADHKLAVALMVEKAAEAVEDAFPGTLYLSNASKAVAAIRTLADTDALAEVQALRDRAAIARFNFDESGGLVRICRGDHPKHEDCGEHEEHFVPRARADAAEVELAATQVKLARVVEAAYALAFWCYEKADPDEDLHDTLFELNAAIEGVKPPR